MVIMNNGLDGGRVVIVYCILYYTLICDVNWLPRFSAAKGMWSLENKISST